MKFVLVLVNGILEGQLWLLLLDTILMLLLHLLLVRTFINAELFYLWHEEAKEFTFKEENARRFEAKFESSSYLF